MSLVKRHAEGAAMTRDPLWARIVAAPFAVAIAAPIVTYGLVRTLGAAYLEDPTAVGAALGWFVKTKAWREATR